MEKLDDAQIAQEVRSRLIEIGGRTSQDLGANRILGQVLILLYLQQDLCSLDEIAQELALSKASVSIAARQLEQLGLIKQAWKPGDRKNYYRTADNIAGALQEGLLSVLRKKVLLFGEELDYVIEILKENDTSDGELIFLHGRVTRASNLQKKLRMFLDNPVVRFFSNDK